MSDTPALISAAQTATAPLDLAQAATEAGFDHLPLALLTPHADLVWLTMITVRAGLGLPSDPLRARGWMKFGNPVEAGDAQPGDVVVVELKDGEPFAGVLASTDRGLHVMVGPDETVRAHKTRLVSARRPIVMQEA